GTAISYFSRRDSDLFNQIGRDSYVQLLETLFQLFLVSCKELSVFDGVGNINKNAYQLVAIGLTGVLPYAVNHLRFRRNAVKVSLKFEEGLADQFVRHCLAVIEAKRLQDFEAALRAA